MFTNSPPTKQSINPREWLLLISKHFLCGNGLPVLIYIILVTSFWWPSLAHGLLIIHGDAAHHGLSLLTMLSNWFDGEDSLLWSSGIYGGHPLFAESQGGFLNPINLLGAYFFEPTYGFGVVHWLDMLISGLGIYCLCRTLDLDRWPGLFAAIAVSYSGIWLGFQYNISVAGALAWLPWLLASVQYWLKAPTLPRAFLMPIPAAFLIFAGYPHLAHGAAIYLSLYLVALVAQKEGRQHIAGNWQPLISGGVIALIFALLLSSVQLLPLYELIQNSHRSEGTSLPLAGLIPASSYFSGMLFFDWQPSPALLSIGSLTSLGVFGLAILLVPLRMPALITAHALSAFMLWNLGVEFASPIFQWIYDNHLIPGLHNYRIMHPFLPLAVIGIAVLAAGSLAALSAAAVEMRAWLPTSRLTPPVVIFFSLALTFLMGLYFYDKSYNPWNLYFPAATFLVVIALTGKKNARHIPLLAALLMASDALILRSNIFNFYPPTVLTEPESVKLIKKGADYSDYRTSLDSGSASMFVFRQSNSPELDVAYKNFLNNLSPFPTLTMGIPSIDGVLGLALHRRSLLYSEMSSEITGQSAVKPGLRLIDILSVKYISRDQISRAIGFELIYQDKSTNTLIYENKYALPITRTYSSALAVSTTEEAFSKLRSGLGDTLYVEAEEPPSPLKANCNDFSSSDARVQWQLRSATRYIATVESRCTGWLYVGDAYFPGWTARINDKPTPLYPAQVLGKAVHFPAGKHQIELHYQPRSFYLGMLLSGLGLITLLGSFLVFRRTCSHA